MSNIKGVMTSYYPLYSSRKMSFNFEVEIKGKMENLEDGF